LSDFPSVQVGKKEAKGIRPDFNPRHTTSLSPETQYVRRPAAGRISLANELDQARERKMGYHIGHRRSAQSGSANQISLGARPRLAKQPQQDLRVGLAEKRGPSDSYGLFRHCEITGDLWIHDRDVMSIMLRHFPIPAKFETFGNLAT
jgi:hypothetical protein